MHRHEIVWLLLSHLLHRLSYNKDYVRSDGDVVVVVGSGRVKGCHLQFYNVIVEDSEVDGFGFGSEEFELEASRDVDGLRSSLES